MVTLQLYIRNQRVDLFDFESVTLVDSIQNIKAIDRLFIAFTRSFSIPASRNNNKILAHFYNENIQGFDPREKIEAEIEINYQSFRKGKIKIESAKIVNGRPHSYNLTFFEDTIDLKYILKEDELSELTWLDEKLTHNFSSLNTTIYAADGLDVVDGGVTYTDALIYPFITHSLRATYDSTAESLNNVYVDSGASPHTGGVFWKELKPAITVSAILKAIQERYPDITFSTDFFSQSNEVISKLYMWLHNKTGDVAEIRADGNVEAPLKLEEVSSSAATIPEVQINEDGTGLEILETDTQGGERYVFNVLAYNSYDQDYILRIFEGKDLVKEVPISTDGTGSPSWITFELGKTIYKGKYRFEIAVPNGITTDISFTYITIDKEELVVSGFLGLFQNTRWESKNQRNTFAFKSKDDGNSISGEVLVKPTKHLPKIKIIDFLSGLFKMFNLVAYKDEDGVIVVKTLDSYYSDSTDVFDITEYVDRTEQLVSIDLPFRELDFTYKGYHTATAQNHKDLFGKEWGEDKYTGDDQKYFLSTNYKLEVPFEHMKFERLFDEADESLKNFLMGTATDKNLNKTATDPLLFYGVSNTENLMIAESVDGDGLVDDASIISNHYAPSNSLDLTNTSQNLNFFPEINEWTLGGSDVDGNIFDSSSNKTLFNTFYSNYVKDVFRPQRRIVKVKAKLPLTTLLKYKLSDTIIVFDKAYRINEIKTNLLTGISELELLNIISAFEYIPYNADDYAEPDSSNISLRADTTTITADTILIRAS